MHHTQMPRYYGKKNITINTLQIMFHQQGDTLTQAQFFETLQNIQNVEPMSRPVILDIEIMMTLDIILFKAINDIIFM